LIVREERLAAKGVVMPVALRERCRVRRRAVHGAGVCVRRGLTLIEILLALAIVVALGAIVLPAFSRGSTPTPADEVAGLIRSAVGEARARAARSGEAWIVSVRESGTQPREGGKREVVIERLEIGEGSAGTTVSSERESSRAIVIGTYRAPRRDANDAARKPSAATGSAEDADRLDSSAPGEEAGSNAPGAEAPSTAITLAMVMPDGNAYPKDSLTIDGESGDAFELRVTSLGVVGVVRLDGSGDDEPEVMAAPMTSADDGSSLDGFAEGAP
jgi:prepilin-type N-terminal cleavage/methylation domain-containing protein